MKSHNLIFYITFIIAMVHWIVRLVRVTIWSHVLLTFFSDIINSYQVSYVMFLVMHTNYSYYWGQKDTLSQLL